MACRTASTAIAASLMAFAFTVRAPSCSDTIALAWATFESMAALPGTAAAAIPGTASAAVLVGCRTATRVMYTGTDRDRFFAALLPSARQSREQVPLL